jgi:hypothetical protein
MSVDAVLPVVTAWAELKRFCLSMYMNVSPCFRGYAFPCCNVRLHGTQC